MNHESIHTGEKNHKCPKCKREFVREVNLATHMKTHKEVETVEAKAFTCAICGKDFESEVLLLAHKALCLAGKPFRFMAYDEMFPQSNDVANPGESSEPCAAEVVVTIDSSGDIDCVQISAIVSDNEQTVNTI